MLVPHLLLSVRRRPRYHCAQHTGKQAYAHIAEHCIFSAKLPLNIENTA